MSLFYRPVWTCGRYNINSNTALMYNLIEGMTFFFEGFSAKVIEYILKVNRNKSFSLKALSNCTNIAEESLIDFLEELMNVGLITDKLPKQEDITSYRINVGYTKKQNSSIEKTTQEKLPYSISSAEQDYANSLKKDQVGSVMFELTYNCSEKCIHCYNPGATRNDSEKNTRSHRREMDLSDYKKTIDELCELGLFKVCLSGGDPFSKPIIWSIIDYLWEKEIAFDIFTNGITITDQVDKLLQYFPRLVGVSIYSGVESDHDYITRTKGSFSKSLHFVEQLSNFGVPINIKCCVMQSNLKSYRTVLPIAKRLGAQAQFEISITDSLDGDICATQNLRLTPEQLEIVLRDDNIPLYVGKEAPNFGGQARDMDSNACGAGSGNFCITPEGNVQPCCAFPTSFGNVCETSLTKIIKKNKELHWWQNITLKEYEDCGRFDYCAYCNLCPGNNFIAHGTFLKASETNCYMAKVRYQLANKMKNGWDPLQKRSIDSCLKDVNVGISPLFKVQTKNYRSHKLKIKKDK